MLLSFGLFFQIFISLSFHVSCFIVHVSLDSYSNWVFHEKATVRTVTAWHLYALVVVVDLLLPSPISSPLIVFYRVNRLKWTPCSGSLLSSVCESDRPTEAEGSGFCSYCPFLHTAFYSLVLFAFAFACWRIVVIITCALQFALSPSLMQEALLSSRILFSLRFCASLRVRILLLLLLLWNVVKCQRLQFFFCSC